MNIDNNLQACACCCIGKQNGEPLCPCDMRAKGVFKRDGKWVQPEIVLGDIKSNHSENPLFGYGTNTPKNSF